MARASKPWRREPPSLERGSALARVGALARATKPWRRELLGDRFSREDRSGLALLGGGFLFLGPLGRVPWLVLDDQAALFRRGALVRQIEQLDDGGDVVVDAELLEHPHIRDASLESRHDLRVRGVGDLVAHLAEALDVLEIGRASCRERVYVLV